MRPTRTFTAVLALTAALALTACAADTDTAAPATTVTETTTAAPAAAVEKTPVACLNALDLAEDALLTSSQLISLAGDVMSGPVPDAFAAAASGDIAGIEQATTEINDATIQQEALSAELDATGYQSAAAACRAAR